MKINLKNKKVAAALSGVLVILTIAGGFGVWSYCKVNALENSYTSIDSSVSYIKDSIIERNNIILESKNDILKYTTDAKLFDDINNKTTKLINLSKFSEDNHDTNNRIDMFNNVNKDVNKLIADLSNNKEIEKNINIVNLKEAVESLDHSIDDYIKLFNTTDRKDYNEILGKFPVNKYAEKHDLKAIKAIEN